MNRPGGDAHITDLLTVRCESSGHLPIEHQLIRLPRGESGDEIHRGMPVLAVSEEGLRLQVDRGQVTGHEK